MQTLCPESGLRTAPDWPKIQKMSVASQFPDMTSSLKFFDVVLFLLSFFSYWSKFYVNIVIGSGIITIFFYKGLTRIPEIGITPFWGLPNISRLGRVMDTKFGTNVSKFQGYSFYRFGIIKEKQPVILPPPPTPRLGLKSKLVCNDLHMRISILLFQ